MAWWDTVDWSDPIKQDCSLNSGLVLWLMGAPNCYGGTRLQDLVNRNHGVLTNMTPANGWVNTEYGPALNFDGTNDDARISSAPLLSIPMTFAVYRVSGNVAAAQASSAAQSIYVQLVATGTIATFNVRNSGPTSGLTNWAAASVAVSDQSGLFVGVSRSATEHSVYAPDGTTATTTVSSGVSSSALRFAMGSVPRSTPIYHAGTSTIAARWNRAMSESEVVELQRQALSGFPDMLRHVRRRSTVSVVAGGGSATPWLYARRQTQIIGGGMGL